MYRVSCKSSLTKKRRSYYVRFPCQYEHHNECNALEQIFSIVRKNSMQPILYPRGTLEANGVLSSSVPYPLSSCSLCTLILMTEDFLRAGCCSSGMNRQGATGRTWCCGPFFSCLIVKACRAPMIATTALAHQARPVNSILVPTA